MRRAAALPSGAGIATRPEGFVVRYVVWLRFAQARVNADVTNGGLHSSRAACSVARRINADEFERCVAKYVRKGHIQTDDSWLRTWTKASLHSGKTSGSGGRK
jgi:hypothetical protein